MVDRDKVQESRYYGTARVQVDSVRDVPVTLWTCYWTFVTRLGLRLMSRGAFPGCQ